MYWLRRLLLLLPGRRRLRARELNEELEANLALAIEEETASGVSPDQAERIARRDFGSLARAREESRAVWFPGWDTLSQDLRFASARCCGRLDLPRLRFFPSRSAPAPPRPCSRWSARSASNPWLP